MQKKKGNKEKHPCLLTAWSQNLYEGKNLFVRSLFLDWSLVIELTSAMPWCLLLYSFSSTQSRNSPRNMNFAWTSWGTVREGRPNGTSANTLQRHGCHSVIRPWSDRDIRKGLRMASSTESRWGGLEWYTQAIIKLRYVVIIFALKSHYKNLPST